MREAKAQKGLYCQTWMDGMNNGDGIMSELTVNYHSSVLSIIKSHTDSEEENGGGQSGRLKENNFKFSN